jgi:hypothetical protein
MTKVDSLNLMPSDITKPKKKYKKGNNKSHTYNTNSNHHSPSKSYSPIAIDTSRSNAPMTATQKRKIEKELEENMKK